MASAKYYFCFVASFLWREDFKSYNCNKVIIGPMVEEGIVVEPQKVEIPLKENDRAHIPLKVIGVPFGNLIFLFNIPDEDSRLIMVLAHKEYPHCGLLSCRVKGIASEDIQTSEEIGGCFPAARTSPFAESLMQQQGEGERERPCEASAWWSRQIPSIGTSTQLSGISLQIPMSDSQAGVPGPGDKTIAS